MHHYVMNPEALAEILEGGHKRIEVSYPEREGHLPWHQARAALVETAKRAGYSVDREWVSGESRFFPKRATRELHFHFARDATQTSPSTAPQQFLRVWQATLDDGKGYRVSGMSREDVMLRATQFQPTGRRLLELAREEDWRPVWQAEKGWLPESNQFVEYDRRVGEKLFRDLAVAERFALSVTGPVCWAKVAEMTGQLVGPEDAPVADGRVRFFDPYEVVH